MTFSATKFGKKFTAGVQMQRPGLLLLDGKIFAAFASHCDFDVYYGWIFKIDAHSGQINDVFLTTGNTSAFGAGIWQSGTGLSSDQSGRLFANVGNAFYAPKYNTSMPGNKPPQVLTESAFKLNTSMTPMTAQDFFMPTNEQYLDSLDLDMGTSGKAHAKVHHLATGHAAMTNTWLQVW